MEPSASETPAARIIAMFGGLSAMARELGHRHASTVQGWQERGLIPIRQQPEVLAAAQRLGIALTAADFLPALPPASPAVASADEAA